MNHKTPKRIALFLNNLEVGGIEKVSIELAQGFLEQGHYVDLVLGQEKGKLLSQIPQNARVIKLEASKAHWALGRLIRYLRQPDAPYALITTTELTGIVAIIAQKLARRNCLIVPIVTTTISFHKRSFLNKILEKLLVSWLYSYAYKVVVVSQAAAKDFIKYTNLSGEKVETIYTPIINKDFYNTLNTSIDHPFFEQAQPVIVSVGRLNVAKDFQTLIEAFYLLRKKMDAKLLILGEGEERKKLEELVSKLELTPDVSMPGVVILPYPYMKRANLFVMSSIWEGLPGALIEAMACHTPVVCTDCQSGPYEILKGGEYGHLVPVKNPKALSVAMEASLKGEFRFPPPEWLEQFRAEIITKAYLDLLQIG